MRQEPELDAFERSNPRHRVTFGFGAFVVGFLVAVSVFALGALLLTLVGGPVNGHQLASAALLALVVGLYAGGVGLVVGAPIAFVLGLLLRPVANQWLHVLAFFLVMTTASFLILVSLSSGDPFGTLELAALIGIAAAIGRFSVWKMMDIH
ncbi:hypothetical protein [Arthrobacter sp. NPDC089319]|uniref:hypothetical protein n=1 Tax=Arthrobacter sp. NPDC089319 TaxID=3155915 RepID=UPI003419947E